MCKGHVVMLSEMQTAVRPLPRPRRLPAALPAVAPPLAPAVGRRRLHTAVEPCLALAIPACCGAAFERLFSLVSALCDAANVNSNLAARLEALVATVSASMADFGAGTRIHFLRRCWPLSPGSFGRPGLSICSAMCTVFLILCCPGAEILHFA
jgi:hypothetical protein